MATEQVPQFIDPGSYADNAMTWLLGTHAKAKMLTVFVGKHYTDLSAADVSDLADIDQSAFHEHIDDLLDIGVVTRTREEDRPRYRLNPDSEVAADLRELQADLISVVAAQHAES